MDIKKKRGRLARVVPEFPLIAREVVLAQIVHHTPVGFARGDRIGEVVVGRGVIEADEVRVGHENDDRANRVEVFHGDNPFLFLSFRRANYSIFPPVCQDPCGMNTINLT